MTTFKAQGCLQCEFQDDIPLSRGFYQEGLRMKHLLVLIADKLGMGAVRDRRHSARIPRKMLHGMSDHALKDIGLERLDPYAQPGRSDPDSPLGL
jgi:hypothetical protein